MDLAFLQLRSNALEIESLFRPYHTPRQLDDRKVQAATRKVRRNVDLITAMGPDPPHDVLYSTLDLGLPVMHARTSSFLGLMSEEEYLAFDKVRCGKMESTMESPMARVLNQGRMLAGSFENEREVDGRHR